MDVRDAAQLEIMCSSDTERGIELQGVVDDMSKPYNTQTLNANSLLKKKGKDADQRVDGLIKLWKNRKASKMPDL